MYNRILKRPMFKRGGPSYQAQGTGITSPFDTPRRQYNTGTSWSEIQENIRKSTADNTTTMQDVAQGFSHLGNPYKDDGSAKTVGEMIWEGSQAVSGARGERKKTAQAGELAAQEVGVEKLKSDLAIDEAEKDRDLKLELGKLAIKSDMLKKEPRNRQKVRNRETLLKISQDPKNESSEFIGVYLNELADGYTDGDLASGAANVINPKLYTKDGNGDWGYDSGNLSVDRVWFDPVTSKWLVFEDTDGDGMADGTPIYSSIDVEDSLDFFNKEPKKSLSSEGENVGENSGKVKKIEKGNVNANGDLIKNKEEIKLKITTNLKDVDINDREFIFSEAEKVGITLVEPDGTKLWAQNLAENEMTLPAFKKLLEEKKMSDTYARLGKKNKRGNFETTEEIKVTEKMATGGVAGEDASVSELDELNNWWRNQLATNWNE